MAQASNLGRLYPSDTTTTETQLFGTTRYMQHVQTSDIILSERPEPKFFAASVGQVWARGMLSFLPMTELMLFVVFAVSGVLFLSTPDAETNRTELTPSLSASTES